MQPINYLLGGKSPMDALFGGIEQVQTMTHNNITNRGNDLLNTRVDDENELLRERQEREMQMHQEIDELDFNDMDAMRAFIARYPKMSEGVQMAYSEMSAKEQKAMLADTSRYISALRNGQSKLAVDDLRAKAQGYRNMGDERRAKEAEDMAALIETSPETALGTLSMGYAVMAPKDGVEGYGNLSETYIAQDKAPHEIDKIEAETGETWANASDIISQTGERDALLPHKQANLDADTGLKTAQGNKAQTEADLAPQQLALEQEKVRINNEIERLKLQLQSENNEIERQKIGVEIARLENQQAQYEAGLTKEQVEQNIKNQERIAQYQSEKENILTTKDTVKRLLNNTQGLKSAVGPLDRWTPTFFAKTKEFEKDLETLQSQVFLAQVSQMKGMGALTEAEGARLESSIANLSLDMDEETMKRNLTLIYDYMNKAEKRLQAKYQDLVSESAKNQTGTIAGRSYMSVVK